MKTYLNLGRFAQNIPQTEAIPGSAQILNNAGGYSWQVNDTTRLQRFLLLGSTNGSYYVGERALTKQHLEVVECMLEQGHGHDILQHLLEISQSGRAVSNDPVLFTLARCSAANDEHVRRQALSLLPKIARTGTHLLHFVTYTKQFRGWGRAYKQAIASWFQNHSDHDLAYQLLKYQQRDGYSQRDLLRLAHPKAMTDTQSIFYHWVTQGWDSVGDLPHPNDALKIIWAYERAKRVKDEQEMASLVRTYHLTRETVPTSWLHSQAVWMALLEHMPIEALLRNLVVMTREQVLQPLSKETQFVIKRLCDTEALVKSRLHPIRILAALTAYQAGTSRHRHGNWVPIQAISNALNDAFYKAFGMIEPTNQRLLLAIDVSGSMHGSMVNGIIGLTAHQAAGAMALMFTNSETNCHSIGIDTSVHYLSIPPKYPLEQVAHKLQSIGGGGTNLALPMQYALQNKLMVDAFVLFTDSESWAGVHPVYALYEYRKNINPQARLVSIQMTATHATNIDPADRLSLDCIGFDVATPKVVSSFIKGEF